jgi:hypothetical protein
MRMLAWRVARKAMTRDSGWRVRRERTTLAAVMSGPSPSANAQRSEAIVEHCAEVFKRKSTPERKRSGGARGALSGPSRRARGARGDRPLSICRLVALVNRGLNRGGWSAQLLFRLPQCFDDMLGIVWMSSGPSPGSQ